MLCPACGASVPDEDLFCESCGQRLSAAPAATALATCACGAAANEVDEEGFCLRCGKRLQRPASDHVEESLSPSFAAISDRGLRHDRNEDRFAIVQVNGDQLSGSQLSGGSVLVVCDGVSASRSSELASSALAQAVAGALQGALERGAVGDPEAAMRAAIQAGAAVVASAAPPASQSDDNPPSSTLVAALVVNGNATLGWVGDSRAYWITAAAAVPLTKDHSWMNAVVDAGEMTAAQAEEAPQAHAITRWIGADSGDAAEPDIARFPLASPGFLLLCTDGLWNYAPSPERMHSLLERAREMAGPDALAMGRYLVDFANGQGGHDNITVALLAATTQVNRTS